MRSELKANWPASDNIRFFRSEYEMLEHLPCKLYKIDEHFELVQKDHAHDYIQIWYVVKGKFTHCMNHHRYPMVAGNLFVIPPYTVHRVELGSGSVEIIGCEFLPDFIMSRYEQHSFYINQVDYAYLEQFLTSVDKVPLKMALSGSMNHRAHQILEEMLEEYQEQKSYCQLMLKGNLLRLLALVVRQFRNNEVKELGDKLDKYRPMINAAIDYIHKHFTGEIRLEHMCKITMLSKTYFCDLFKYFTGKTLTDYVIELRLQHSMEMLLQPERTVTEVCYKAGFKDLAYFSRIFKKHTGMSPSSYKKYAVTLPNAKGSG